MPGWHNDAYRTGRGKITMRGRTHIEEGKEERRSSLYRNPLHVNKTNLIETIAKNVRTKLLTGLWITETNLIEKAFDCYRGEP